MKGYDLSNLPLSVCVCEERERGGSAREREDKL
jgi:hypothetical protein